MLAIILLTLGIIYFYRRSKINAMVCSNYPDVPADRFEEWKALELKSIDIFLWATWGLLIISIPLFILVLVSVPGAVIGVQYILFFMFLILLLISAFRGSKAAAIKKQYGIK